MTAIAHAQDADAELVERLRRQAERASAIARQMAEDKSLRQGGNTERRTDLYMWPTPEQTVEGRAADRIEALARLSVTTPDTTVLVEARNRIVKQIDMALQMIGVNDEPGSEHISLTPHGWEYIIAAFNGARAALASTANPTGAPE